MKKISIRLRAKKTEGADSSGATFNLAHCFENHQLFVEEYFDPREGVTERDLFDFAVMGDLITQGYFLQLKKQVPLKRENEYPLIPHHLEKMLLSHVSRLNDMLCELARAGRWNAGAQLWDEALKLSQTFGELALKHPAPFRMRARRALFMPSVRAKNPKYTADAKTIANQIELSAETVGDRLTDNRKRIGALCAGLIAECVDEIIHARSLWARFFTQRDKEVIWPALADIQPYVTKTTDQLLSKKIDVMKEPHQEFHLRFFCLCHGGGQERLHFLCLPELTQSSSPHWWKHAIETMVEARFPALLEQPAWFKELKAISTGTRADMLKELKDYSREKVKQFAPKPERRKTSAIKTGR